MGTTTSVLRLVHPASARWGRTWVWGAVGERVAVFVLVVALCGVALAGRASAQSQPQDARNDVIREFRRAVASWLPESGSWEAMFIPPGSNRFGATTVGYDWDTGCWYLTTSGTAKGRDTEGERFSGSTHPTTDVVSLGRAGAGSDASLDLFFPAVLVRDLLARPELVAEASRTADGGFEIVSALPGASRETSLPGPPREAVRVTMRFDRSGRLVHRSFTLGDGHLVESTLEYDERCPETFPIPSRIRSTSEFELGAIVHTDGSSPERFARARVVGVSLATGDDSRRGMVVRNPWQGDTDASRMTGVHRTVLAARGLEAGTTLPASLAGPLASVAPGPLDRYRWPLVLTGATVVGVALVARRLRRS